MNSSSSSSTSGKPPMPRVLPPQAKPSQQQQAAASAAAAAAAKNHIPPVTPTAAGSGRLATGVGAGFAENRTPVTWTSLFLVAVVAASAVAYYRIERERRLEAAMGKVVSSESEGWTPKPDLLARRKFVKTTAGWLPIDDGWGAREFVMVVVVAFFECSSAFCCCCCCCCCCFVECLFVC